MLCFFPIRIRSFRARVACTLVLLVVITYAFIWVIHTVEYDETRDPFSDSADIGSSEVGKFPILIWWTPFTGEDGIHRKCSNQICFFTTNRKFFSHPAVKGFLFYGSDFKAIDLPVPRLPQHDWALLHEESPKNNFLFSTKKVMELFNHTATFRRTSDLPLTLQYLESLESLKSKKYYIPTEEKNQKLQTLSPVLYIHSDCDTPSDRDSYIRELMKFIKVDSYGKCLHNKDLPPNLTDPMVAMSSDEFFNIAAQYKFTLAFENAVCEDYVTEKLWRPLMLGSVPVYYGSPTVQDWLPNANSAIMVTNYRSPKQLADYLSYLNNNDTAYEALLEHKIHHRVKNSQLLQALEARKWGINNDFKKGSFIDHFECLICGRISRNMLRERTSLPVIHYRARYNHYGCPKPVSALTGEPDKDSWWLELYNKAQYEAQAVEQLVNSGHNFSANEFFGLVIRILESQTVT